VEFSGKIEQGEFHMKSKRFTEKQIIKILKEAEAGVPIPDLCRQQSTRFQQEQLLQVESQIQRPCQEPIFSTTWKWKDQAFSVAYW